MGGMQTFSPVREEKNEPVFHAPWEGRIFAIFVALGTLRKWNRDMGRQTREAIPAPEYLSMNYNQMRCAQVVELVVQNGLATRAEIETANPCVVSSRLTPASRLIVSPLSLPLVRPIPAMSRWRRRSKPVSVCERAISIHRRTRACRATHEAGWESSSEITAYLYFLTAMRNDWVKGRNIFIRYVSRRGNFGAIRRSGRIPSLSPCGTITLNRLRVLIVRRGMAV
jgi:hypothetical protein